jgi:hypothetical protein
MEHAFSLLERIDAIQANAISIHGQLKNVGNKMIMGNTIKVT